MYDLFSIVEKCTIISSLIMIFSGFPVCFNVYKKKDVSNFPFSFFMVGTILSVNGIAYGFLQKNNAILFVNFVSTAASFFALGIYLRVTKCNVVVVAQILMATLSFLAYHIATVNYSETLQIYGDYVGLFGAVGVFIINSIPIIEVIRSFQRGDSSAIVLPMLIAGTINMTCWIVYGLLLEDFYVVAPNIPCGLVNLLRFVVIGIYPKKWTSKPIKTESAKDK